MNQLSLFDALHEPAIRRPVDRYGEVVRGNPDETLVLPHPRLAWDLARIELHRHTDGLWMWSASTCGRGYKVGPKWGQFARSRGDALYHGAQEILDQAAKVRDPAAVFLSPAQHGQIQAWARGFL